MTDELYGMDEKTSQVGESAQQIAVPVSGSDGEQDTAEPSVSELRDRITAVLDRFAEGGNLVQLGADLIAEAICTEVVAPVLAAKDAYIAKMVEHRTIREQSHQDLLREKNDVIQRALDEIDRLCAELDALKAKASTKWRWMTAPISGVQHLVPEGDGRRESVCGEKASTTWRGSLGGDAFCAACTFGDQAQPDTEADAEPHDCEARCTRQHVPPDGTPFGAAELLRLAGRGRDVYAEDAPDDAQHVRLMIEAQTYYSAANLIEDPSRIELLIPSWMDRDDEAPVVLPETFGQPDTEPTARVDIDIREHVLTGESIAENPEYASLGFVMASDVRSIIREWCTANGIRVDPEPSEQAEPVWKIEVDIPTRVLGVVDHEALFKAVADAAHAWEPAERDSWDVEVSSGVWALPDGAEASVAPATPTEPCTGGES